MERLPRPRRTSTLLALLSIAAPLAVASVAHALPAVEEGLVRMFDHLAERPVAEHAQGSWQANAMSTEALGLGDSIAATAFPTAIPEPRTTLMLALGLVGLGVAGGRREALRA